jgi:NADPH-dependent dioxygenase
VAKNVPGDRTQVLIVGAGLVALTAALRLSCKGFAVRVIERRHDGSARAFPVVLHARSVQILESLGIESSVLERGARIRRFSLCQHGREVASLNASTSEDSSSRILTLEHGMLRQAMVDTLGRRGVNVEYNTRLTALQQDESGVDVCTLEHDYQHAVLFPAQPAKTQRHVLRAQFVIGADGYESMVRAQLGLRLQTRGPLEAFAFFVGMSRSASDDATLDLTDGQFSSALPLPGGKVRLTFQVGSALDRAQDGRALSRLLGRSLSGYQAIIERAVPSGVAEFRSAVVPRFGTGRVWLAGDAAHMAPPIGAWSVNAGMDEASELAVSMAEALRSPAGLAFGAGYDARRSSQWRRYFNLQRAVAAHLPGWARALGPRLAWSLPASGEDLSQLLEQLSAVTDVCFEPPTKPALAWRH